jgi:imidazolonepropionase-like amidohydrolase
MREMRWRLLLYPLLLLAAAAAALLFALAPPRPLRVPERGAVLADVTLVQPGEWRQPARRVAVEGGAIREIGPASGRDEYSGLYALPGLIDMHVHFPPGMPLGQTEHFALLYLRHGVTSVRDAGDPDGTSTAPARDGVRAGRFPGPRVFACGPFLDGPAPIWPNSVAVRDADEARAAVERVAAEGFDCVKAYEGLTPGTLAAVRETAHARGLAVIGHVPRAVAFEDARLDDVQHLTGVRDAVGDTRPFPRTLDGWRTLDEARARFVVETSRAQGIAHTPTLVTLEGLAAVGDWAAARERPDAKLLPGFYRNVIWSPREGVPLLRGLGAEEFALLREAVGHGQRFVARLHAAGVRIHAGTDTLNPFLVPGAALHREIALLAEAGLGPEGALAAASAWPGEALRTPRLGRLEPGAPADLALFREDPTRDLAALATLEAVVADGRLYTRADLDAQLARSGSHFDGRLFDAVSQALVRRVMAQLFEKD